jgi:hypothetical protein
MNLSAGWDLWLSRVSFGLMILALLVGAGIILGALFKARKLEAAGAPELEPEPVRS